MLRSFKVLILVQGRQAVSRRGCPPCWAASNVIQSWFKYRAIDGRTRCTRGFSEEQTFVSRVIVVMLESTCTVENTRFCGSLPRIGATYDVLVVLVHLAFFPLARPLTLHARLRSTHLTKILGSYSNKSNLIDMERRRILVIAGSDSSGGASVPSICPMCSSRLTHVQRTGS